MQVCSPPFSGKTSLIALLTGYLSERANIQVVNISMLGMYDSNPESFCLKNYGCSLSQLFTPEFIGSKQILILIDQARTLYSLGAEHPFWTHVKNALTNSISGFHMILFCTYGQSPLCVPGYSTPVLFPPENSIDITTLRFTPTEYKELVDSYNKTTDGALAPISKEVAAVVHQLTKGHPGLTRLCLVSIAEEFKGKIIEHAAILEFLLRKFKQKCYLTRTVPKDESVEGKEIMKQIIFSHTGQIPFPSDETTLPCVQRLIVCGALAPVLGASYLEFSSPIVQTIFTTSLVSSPSTIVGKIGVEFFLKDCLAHLNPATLKDFFSQGGDKKGFERKWQLEFYRTATGVGPRYRPISFTGHIFNSYGYFDFYVAELQWAIGVSLEEGTEIAQRNKEIISPFIQESKHVILEFRAKEIDEKQMKNGFWYITYNQAFTSVTVKRLGKESLSIKLQ